MFFFVLTSVLLAIGIFLWSIFFRVGLFWAKVGDTPRSKFVRAIIAAAMLRLLVFVAAYFVYLQIGRVLSVGLVTLLVAELLTWAAMRTVLQLDSVRLLKAWLPTTFATLITILFALVVVHRLVFENFQISSNSMAPTLLGPHLRGTCRECGAATYCSPRVLEMPSSLFPTVICENFHTTQPADLGDRIHSADRVIVNRQLKPQRWDLVVFQFPDDPSVPYVFRLVGLPGEEIVIREGSVWANSEKLVPPDSIRGIKYVADLEGLGTDAVWGSPNLPAKLADDEYFVLGDFTHTSRDSRLWQVGAPGHKPYAVPESHLRGVVTRIYWPLDRWRTLK